MIELMKKGGHILGHKVVLYFPIGKNVKTRLQFKTPQVVRSITTLLVEIDMSWKFLSREASPGELTTGTPSKCPALSEG